MGWRGPQRRRPVRISRPSRGDPLRSPSRVAHSKRCQGKRHPSQCSPCNLPHFSYTIPVFMPPARNSYTCTICRYTEYDDGEMRAGMAKKVLPEQQLPLASYRNQQLFSNYYLANTLPQRVDWQALALQAQPVMAKIAAIFKQD